MSRQFITNLWRQFIKYLHGNVTWIFLFKSQTELAYYGIDKIRDDINIFIPHVFESVSIETTPLSGKHSIIGLIYRPNTKPLADLDIFATSLSEILDIINNEHKQSIIMGDMNINLLKYDTHSKTNDYLNNLFSHGFLPLITKPTRVTPVTASMIGHIYTNNILHPGFSERNTSVFKDLLEETNFDPICQINDPNEAYTKFMKLYQEAFDKAFPLTDMTPKNKQIKKEPWITKGIIKSSKTKSKLLLKKTKKNNDENIRIYKLYNNILTKTKKAMKRTYFQNALNESK